MHALPCAASGGEDGVCVALSQLSKELLDANTTGLQAGGCDSSDCLFCQYRSNSPFHLNAYAGKLTSLLRKRSLNGMTLASLNSLIDASSEPGATLLAAATAAISSSGKRQRAVSSSGRPAAALSVRGPANSSAAGDIAGLTHPQLHANPDLPHDCLTMCGGSSCHDHNKDHPPSAKASFPSVATAAMPAASDWPPAQPERNLEASPSEPPVTQMLAGTAEATAMEDRLAPSQAGLGPSSLDLLHQSQQQLLSSARGTSSAMHRHLSGRQLPQGWSFQPEWELRPGPAPAELKEVLRLPDAMASSRADSSRRQRDGMGSAGCRGSAGIICALEFSPDGRLLAAGGVDKQIRFYNLSDVFGETHDGDDHDLGDQAALPGLEPQRRSASPPDLGAGKERGRGGAADRQRGRGDDSDDDEGEERDSQGGSLLAAVQRMPSKISSLAWSPFLDCVLTVGDYDGVLLQLHIASGHQLADVEAHGGRKIWSVAHSSLVPNLVASAADDRCARLWTGRGLSDCVGTLQPNPRASVCSVDFSPDCDRLLALACSDRTAYLYDMRNLGGGPLAALRHHERPASYCRFLGGDRLVTAATDASLALWDVSGAIPTIASVMAPPSVLSTAATGEPPLAGMEYPSPFNVVQTYEQQQQQQTTLHEPASGGQVTPGACVGGGSRSPRCGGAIPAAPARVFRGHRNEKNFVGLSVRAADGLLACGSECNRAFAYHTSWTDPLATMDIAGTSAIAVEQPLSVTPEAPGHGGLRRISGMGSGGFVSAVCWQPADAAALLGLPPLLASATSMGSISLTVLAARP